MSNKINLKSIMILPISNQIYLKTINNKLLMTIVFNINKIINKNKQKKIPIFNTKKIIIKILIFNIIKIILV